MGKWQARLGASGISSGGDSPFPANLDFYLAADAANANDANPGTIAAPWKTLDHAIAVINALGEIPQGSSIMLHIATAASPYTYSMSLTVRNVGALVIYGDGAGQVGDDGFTVLDTGVCDAGTTTTLITKVGGGMTIDAFEGKTIEMLDGAAAGQRRTIRDNLAASLVPSTPFVGAPVAGDTYRVLEPAVEIQAPVTSFTTPTITQFVPFLQGLDGPVSANLGDGVVAAERTQMWNLRIRPTADPTAFSYFMFSGSSVACFGVEFFTTQADRLSVVADENSGIMAGKDTKGVSAGQSLLPFFFGAAPSAGGWNGWGVASLVEAPGTTTKAVTWTSVTRLHGFFVGQGPLQISGGNWELTGGGVHVVVTSAALASALDIRRWSNLRLFGNAGTPCRLRCEGAGLTTAVLSVRGGSQAMVAANVTLEKTNSGYGILLYNVGSGQGALPGRCSVEGDTVVITGITDASAPDYGMAVAGAGNLLTFRSAPTMSGWPAGQQAVVLQESSPAVVVQAVDLAGFFTAQGIALPDAATSDGRNGWIARASD
jgi:hypothetical protein